MDWKQEQARVAKVSLDYDLVNLASTALAALERVEELDKAIEKSVLHYEDEEVDGRFIDPEILAEELGLLTWKGRDKRFVTKPL